MTLLGGASLTLCVALLAGCADGPGRSAPPTGGVACNGPCRWWMSLGAKREEAVPPAAIRRPAKPVREAAAVPQHLAATPRHPRPDRIVRVSAPPIALARIASPAPVAPAGEPPAAHPADGGWGVPIPGSDPVQPGTWEPLR